MPFFRLLCIQNPVKDAGNKDYKNVMFTCTENFSSREHNMQKNI